MKIITFPKKGLENNFNGKEIQIKVKNFEGKINDYYIVTNEKGKIDVLFNLTKGERVNGGAKRMWEKKHFTKIKNEHIIKNRDYSIKN